ncbi:MAG: hypothetical protein KDD52_00500 [Bdellovibrionales bacterium]|nr:hypothetical protein [Bdellovibrionales bacterium]
MLTLLLVCLFSMSAYASQGVLSKEDLKICARQSQKTLFLTFESGAASTASKTEVSCELINAYALSSSNPFAIHKQLVKDARLLEARKGPEQTQQALLGLNDLLLNRARRYQMFQLASDEGGPGVSKEQQAKLLLYIDALDYLSFGKLRYSNVQNIAQVIHEATLFLWSYYNSTSAEKVGKDQGFFVLSQKIRRAQSFVTSYMLNDVYYKTDDLSEYLKQIIRSVGAGINSYESFGLQYFDDVRSMKVFMSWIEATDEHVIVPVMTPGTQPLDVKYNTANDSKKFDLSTLLLLGNAVELARIQMAQSMVYYNGRYGEGSVDPQSCIVSQTFLKKRKVDGVAFDYAWNVGNKRVLQGISVARSHLREIQNSWSKDKKGVEELQRLLGEGATRSEAVDLHRVFHAVDQSSLGEQAKTDFKIIRFLMTDFDHTKKNLRYYANDPTLRKYWSSEYERILHVIFRHPSIALITNTKVFYQWFGKIYSAEEVAEGKAKENGKYLNPSFMSRAGLSIDKNRLDIVVQIAKDEFKENAPERCRKLSTLQWSKYPTKKLFWLGYKLFTQDVRDNKPLLDARYAPRSFFNTSPTDKNVLVEQIKEEKFEFETYLQMKAESNKEYYESGFELVGDYPSAIGAALSENSSYSIVLRSLVSHIEELREAEEERSKNIEKAFIYAGYATMGAAVATGIGAVLAPGVAFYGVSLSAISKIGFVMSLYEASTLFSLATMKSETFHNNSTGSGISMNQYRTQATSREFYHHINLMLRYADDIDRLEIGAIVAGLAAIIDLAAYARTMLVLGEKNLYSSLDDFSGFIAQERELFIALRKHSVFRSYSKFEFTEFLVVLSRETEGLEKLRQVRILLDQGKEEEAAKAFDDLISILNRRGVESSIVSRIKDTFEYKIRSLRAVDDRVRNLSQNARSYNMEPNGEVLSYFTNLDELSGQQSAWDGFMQTMGILSSSPSTQAERELMGAAYYVHMTGNDASSNVATTFGLSNSVSREKREAINTFIDYCKSYARRNNLSISNDSIETQIKVLADLGVLGNMNFGWNAGDIIRSGYMNRILAQDFLMNHPWNGLDYFVAFARSQNGGAGWKAQIDRMENILMYFDDLSIGGGKYHVNGKTFSLDQKKQFVDEIERYQSYFDEEGILIDSRKTEFDQLRGGVAEESIDHNTIRIRRAERSGISQEVFYDPRGGAMRALTDNYRAGIMGDDLIRLSNAFDQYIGGRAKVMAELDQPNKLKDFFEKMMAFAQKYESPRSNIGTADYGFNGVGYPDSLDGVAHWAEVLSHKDAACLELSTFLHFTAARYGLESKVRLGTLGVGEIHAIFFHPASGLMIDSNYSRVVTDFATWRNNRRWRDFLHYNNESEFSIYKPINDSLEDIEFHQSDVTNIRVGPEETQFFTSESSTAIQSYQRYFSNHPGALQEFSYEGARSLNNFSRPISNIELEVQGYQSVVDNFFGYDHNVYSPYLKQFIHEMSHISIPAIRVQGYQQRFYQKAIDFIRQRSRPEGDYIIGLTNHRSHLRREIASLNVEAGLSKPHFAEVLIEKAALCHEQSLGLQAFFSSKGVKTEIKVVIFIGGDGTEIPHTVVYDPDNDLFIDSAWFGKVFTRQEFFSKVEEEISWKWFGANEEESTIQIFKPSS